MQLVADLHVHSKYSRAVSPAMVLTTMSEFGKRKGIDILPIPDWTHPLWIREVKNQVEEVNAGVFKVKQKNNNILFLLSTEISSIYSQGGKTRRVHNLVLAPGLETVERINLELVRRGCNLSSDGRPIIGISSKDLLEMVLAIDEKSLLIPCHAWTPWFSVFGSKSGFDSLEECFGDYSKYIYAVETGLSSDPEMNWRIKELDNRSILSSSDSHSPMKMGRESTVFTVNNLEGEKNISYEDIRLAIMQKEGNLKIGFTIEFYPEEGKYHYSGHRACKVVHSPFETRQRGVNCPVCNKPLTLGVMHRVDEIADREALSAVKTDKFGVNWIVDPTLKHPPFVKLVPLIEIIAEAMGSTVSSAKVGNVFDEICEKFGSEIKVLLKIPIEEIKEATNKAVGDKIAEGVRRVRQGSIMIEPGFDGEYGKVKIWGGSEEKKRSKNSLNNQIGLDF